MNFWDTEAGRLITYAASYMKGAATLSAAQPKEGRAVFLPTLSLAGQGLELMLKACCRLNDQDYDTGTAGHKILPLWRSDVCEPVRGHTYQSASFIAQELAESGLYRDKPMKDPIEEIEGYVSELCKLHAMANYPLRYPKNPGIKGPRTPFLVQTLNEVAQTMVRNPMAFHLDTFHGR